MRIAIPALEKSLDSAIAPTFGRAPGFLIIELKGNQIQSYDYMPNPGASSWRGAGISSAQAVINNGVNVVIAQSIGPNSFDILFSSHVDVYQSSGTVRDAINKFLSGSLTKITAPNETGRGFGRFFGRGFGRGRRWQ